MQLRDYQQDLIDRTRQEFALGRKKVLMQSPTGSGKTVTFVHIIANAIAKGKKVLILAHRKELIEQAWRTLKKADIVAGIVMAGIGENLNLSVQVASVQTLVRRLDRPLPDFDLIVIDEAHHTSSNSYTTILSRFPKAFVLGVTATPCRLDGKGLGDLFESLVHGEQISALIDQGHLVKPIYASTEGLDLSGVKITAGDYNKAALIDAVHTSQINGELVSHWRQFANGMQTIVFAVDCEHSREIVQAYTDAGISAAHVDGESPPDYRRHVIEKFGAKEITVLSNVNIFTEGFDIPSIECVQLARPTKSISLYFQMIGRALRPNEGKTHAIVLDHVNAFHDHGSVADPFLWELEITRKKRSREVGETDPDKPIKERIINADGSIQLVLVGENEDIEWLKKLQELVGIMAKNGYERTWVYHRFIRDFPDPTLEQLNIMGKAIKCHWKWAARMFEVHHERA